MRDYVLITGATSGIGREFVKLFALDGYNIVLTSTSKELLDKEKKELENKYKDIKIYTIAKDLSKEDSAKEIYEELEKEKINVSILINNAGFGYFGKLVDSNIEKNNNLLMVNNNALVKLSYYFGKAMAKRKKGKILNVGSIAAFQGGPYMATYYASKAFVVSFSEALREELKNDNVVVSCLCPGPTRTNFEKNANLQKSYMFKKMDTCSAEYVARIGYNALMKGKSLVTSGFPNKIVVFLTRLSPRIINAKVSGWINLGKLNK